VTFELALAGDSVTVSSVMDDLQYYKQAIADSFTGVNIEPSQVEIEVSAAQRLRRLLGGVVLDVTITAYDIDSSQSIQGALVSADDDFGAKVSEELMNSHSITTAVTIDAETISTTILVSPTPSPTPPVTEAEGAVDEEGGGNGAIFGAVGALVVLAVLAVMYRMKGKGKEVAKAKVYSEPPGAGDATTPGQAVGSGRAASVQPIVPVLEEESKEEDLVAAFVLAPEIEKEEILDEMLEDEGMNVLGPPTMLTGFEDSDDE
jgi:hypothetical protein